MCVCVWLVKEVFYLLGEDQVFCEVEDVCLVSPFTDAACVGK